MSDIDPVEAIVRYEHVAPVDMPHNDSKNRGRIECPSQRVTGNRRDSVDGAGWEMWFVAIDDHARIAFGGMHVDERTLSAVQLLREEVAYGAGLSLSVRGLLTNNGSAFRSNKFASARKAFGMRHRFTRPYRPQTNGKPERFIQSTLCEWPYGFPYQHLTGHTKALDL